MLDGRGVSCVAVLVTLVASGCAVPGVPCSNSEQGQGLCIREDAEPLAVPTTVLPDAVPGAEYHHPLRAIGGAPPYRWSLVTASRELHWLKVDTENSRITGTPGELVVGASFQVGVTDASGRTATGTFLINVRTCISGKTQPCFVSSDREPDKCQAGTQMCSAGVLGECVLGEMSTEVSHCGAKCGTCNEVAADRCLDGRCSCGEGPPCGEGAQCCGGRCVAPEGDPNHCGGCGVSCETDRLNIERTCTAGVCEYPCTRGWARCGDPVAASCQTNVLSDVNNCGGCGVVCDVPPGAASVACVEGQCQVASCGQGRADCNGLHPDGCEVDLNADVNHCGTCVNSCGPAPSATPVCSSGACALSCSAGFANCDGAYANGCEANLGTSFDHCGACGNECGSRANTTATTCSGGACAVTSCAYGFANCNGLYPDGCEAALATNPNHCGSCANNCFARPNVTGAACQNYSCAITTCAPGWANCDNSWGNGCERDVRSDENNCGACGVQCAFYKTCVNGTCQ